MKRVFLVFILSFYLLLPNFALAEITSPYAVDEKIQVMFGDSTTIVATSTYQGLENYTHEYVNDYLHISFTYTHHRIAFSDYPPRLYITTTDPRATTTPVVRDQQIVYQLMAIPVPPGHETDWYLYDAQFDATGYTVVVKEAGETEIINEHRNIGGLVNGDWAALANLYPNSGNAFSMAFTPLEIYDAPVISLATTTPVIIVPGITSSVLSNSNGERWPNTTLMALSFEDLYLNDLILSGGGEDISSTQVGSIVRSLLGNDFFTGLFSKLNTSGLIENTDVFEYPYDWRLDILKTASDNESNAVTSLKEKIDAVKAQRGVTKVNLLAHSMGGLLVKKYLKDYGGDSIDKFIDIGTPHTGAPKAFKILSYGDNFDASFLFGVIGLNAERVKVISQNMFSIYQLLPSQEYFDDTDNNYKYYVFNVASGEDRLTFDQTKSYLNSSGRNSALVDRANAFHQEIDNLNPATYGVTTYNIVGCGTPTIGQFYILDNSTSHPIYNIKMINGDGTVPLRSAEAISATSTYYVHNAQHALLPSTSGVKELVAGILTSTSTSFDISSYSNLSITSSGCTIPDGRIVSFHSPIELHIYDSSGNHTGPDANGDIENNIAGVTYEVIDDNKFAYLPNGANYTVKGNATDSGTFDVRIQDVVNGEVVTTTLFSDLPLTSVTHAQFALGSTLPTKVDLDSNNDGIFEHSYDVSNTATGIVESTGKIATVSSLKITDTTSSRPLATSSVVIIKIATSSPEIVKLISTTSPQIISVIPKSKKLEPVPYDNTAIVYKSFGYKFKTGLLKVWSWFKSKL